MAENPFVPASPNSQNFGPGMDRGDLLRWCDDQNQLPMSKSNGWWYYVQRNVETGLHYVQKLEGGLGEEVQRYAGGWRSKFLNWSPSDLAAYDRKLNDFMRRGISPEQGAML